MRSREIDDKKINILIEDITKKKELQEISDEFVVRELLNYVKTNPKAQKFLSQPKPLNTKSAMYKSILKGVRARLRKVYGLYREESELSKREDLISALLEKASAGKIDPEIIIDILRTHSSTHERAYLYEQLYKRIFEITDQPKSILDLGCGINPFSIIFMKPDLLKYYAYDLSTDEIDNLNDFFRLINKIYPEISGRAEVLDVLQFSKLPAVDVCFLFKMTDVLERGKGHKVTEQILKMIPAKFVVVSFPTKTMSGKKMNFPRRRWIELMCKRLGYTFEMLTFANELFYVVKKSG